MAVRRTAIPVSIAEPSVTVAAPPTDLQFSKGARYATGLIYVAMVVVLTLFQLATGANMLLLAVLVLCALSMLIPFFARSWCAADILWAVFAAYSGFLPLVIKTWIGQPIDSNLVTPELSVGYFAIGTLSAAVGYLLARTFVRPSSAPFQMTRLTADRRVQRSFAVPLFAIGYLAQVVHTILRPRFEAGGTAATDGFGGLGVLAVLWMIGLAMQAVRWRQERGNPVVGLVLGGMFVALIGLAIISNVKKPVFDGLVMVGLAIVTLQNTRVRPAQLILLALPLPILLLYVAPLIQVMRPQLRTFQISEIMDVGGRTLAEADYDPTKLADRADRVAQGYTFSFRPNGTYLYPDPMNADRFALIMPTDQVVRELRDRGPMGLLALSDIPEAYLPGPLYQKSGIASNDRIAWHFGLRRDGVVARPVIGLVASAIAVSGITGAAFLPGIVILLFFSISNILAGPLGRGAWSISIITLFLQRVAEREVSGIVNTGAREIPFILVVAAAIWFVHVYLLKRDRVRGRPTGVRPPIAVNSNRSTRESA